MSNYSKTLGAVRSTGQMEKEFPISMGPRFLELFSENLYSSPNKAFEELVANSWDADATAVYISIPKNLRDPEAAIWVLDNGTSMDGDGLETLWRITSGHKRTLKDPRGLKSASSALANSRPTFSLPKLRSYAKQVTDLSAPCLSITEILKIWMGSGTATKVRLQSE